jgi:hypothetical protein
MFPEQRESAFPLVPHLVRGGGWQGSSLSDIIGRGGLGENFKAEQFGLGKSSAGSCVLGLTDPDNHGEGISNLSIFILQQEVNCLSFIS